MASINEEGVIEKFIKPTRCLYSEYSITIDKFKEENGLLLANHDLEDLGEDLSFKLYGEFTEDHDGEIACESVQTWICDNRLEVTNCIRLALNSKKESFCNWFRSSEEYSSPDELLLYCLARQNNWHVSIFNSKYVWSTLSHHIKYDYFEVVKKSDINLVFIGPRHYAIFRKKTTETTSPDTPGPAPKSKRGRGRGRSVSTKKTVCRSSAKNPKSAVAKQTSSSTKKSQTLASARNERYGVGRKSTTNNSELEKYGRGKRKKGYGIDYSKLNEGIDQDETESPSPKRSKHTPVRSGPSLERQTAQKRVTINPSVTTLSTVKTKKTVDSEEPSIDSTPIPTLIGVQTPTETTLETVDTAATSGVRDAFLGVPDANELLLPDLGASKEVTYEDVLKQTSGNVSEHSQEPSQEDELDAADALLSLSNLPTVGNDDFDFGLEDNALLAPIGGNIICEDVAPTTSMLGQVDVDNQIARHIAQDEYDDYTAKQSESANADLIGVPPSGVSDIDKGTSAVTDVQLDEESSLIGVPPDPAEKNMGVGNTNKEQPAEQSERPPPTSDTPKGGARPKTTQPSAIVDKPGSRGAFKSQLHGLRRGRPKDRAYKCKVCEVSKRSMEALNIHHRKHHDPQKCGVCGKVFDLASSRTHHMYSHYARKYQCDKCSFHCFFNSELEAHKFVHREKPTFKCMYPKCGRWFKRKGELSLHVEVHNSTWYDCKKCDFSTKLIKYLKEHEKSHLKKTDELPYACGICGERFMWRSGVKRHKEKKH